MSSDFVRTSEHQALRIFVSRSGGDSMYLPIQLKNQLMEWTIAILIQMTPRSSTTGETIIGEGKLECEIEEFPQRYPTGDWSGIAGE